MKRVVVAVMIFGAPLCGLTVSSTTTLSDSGTTNSFQQLSLEAGGQAMAIWQQANPNAIEAAYFNGTTWSAAQFLGYGTFPQVAITGSGDAIAVWIANINQVYASYFTASTQTWSSATQLSTSNTTNAAPRIAMNTVGDALAIWVLASPQSILGATYTPATGWSSATTLVSGESSFPVVALDDTDQAVVTWIGNSFDVKSITVTIP